MTGLATLEIAAATPFWRVLFDEAWYVSTHPEAARLLENTGSLSILDCYLAFGAAQGHAATPFFDAEWYLATYPNIPRTTGVPRFIAALTHYLLTGVEEGHNPNPVFDETWYRTRYGIDGPQWRNGYHHFLAEGAARGCSPSPLFDEQWYRKRYADADAAIRSGLLASGYHDYIRRAPAEERNPSPYFDLEWYRSRYPASGSGRRLRYFEYLTSGARTGYSPGPLFDESWYRVAHAEVRVALHTGRYVSGYHHYLYEGSSTNFAPNPYFMPQWYLSWYADARRQVESGEYAHAFEHYVLEGAPRGLGPNPYFDEGWYLAQNPEIKAVLEAGTCSSGHQHYLDYGQNEPRSCSTVFDASWYRSAYPDVNDFIANHIATGPYDHFCRYGRAAGRNCSADFDERWYLDHYPDVRQEIEAGRWTSGLHHFISEGLLLGYDPRPGALRDRREHNATVKACANLELRDFLSTGKQLQLAISTQPLVSIVVVLYNCAELTLRCLRSIAAWAGIPCEVIAVDNNSQDSTPAMLERVTGVRVVRNPVNHHFLAAANQAARAAAGKYLLFLNNDSELQVGAIEAAVRVLEREPDVGAVGAKIILHNGRLQEAGSYLRCDAFPVQYGRGKVPFENRFMHRRDVPYVSGAFLMTPRQLFLETGAFDPVFLPAYCEDVDYCLRLWRRGLRVVFNPECIILHHEGGSSAYQRFLFPSVLRNIAALRYRYQEYLAGVPDYGIAPVSSLDGKNFRPAFLVIVEHTSDLETPGTRRLIDGFLAGRIFVTVYPLETWNAEREEIRSLLGEEVELVAGGAAELECFCVRRKQLYERVIVLTEDERVTQSLAGLRAWLPDARIFARTNAA